jgi:hypothetical protein
MITEIERLEKRHKELLKNIGILEEKLGVPQMERINWDTNNTPDYDDDDE